MDVDCSNLVDILYDLSSVVVIMLRQFMKILFNCYNLTVTVFTVRFSIHIAVMPITGVNAWDVASSFLTSFSDTIPRGRGRMLFYKLLVLASVYEILPPPSAITVGMPHQRRTEIQQSLEEGCQKQKAMHGAGPRVWLCCCLV